MIVQKHREYEKDSKYGCFSVGRSEQEIFDDLKEFAKEHLNERIYYYVHPVRPVSYTHLVKILLLKILKYTEMI